jgi:hypothetical protein
MIVHRFFNSSIIVESISAGRNNSAICGFSSLIGASVWDYCLNQQIKSGLPSPAPCERRVSFSCGVGCLDPCQD